MCLVNTVSGHLVSKRAHTSRAVPQQIPPESSVRWEYFRQNIQKNQVCIGPGMFCALGVNCWARCRMRIKRSFDGEVNVKDKGDLVVL